MNVNIVPGEKCVGVWGKPPELQLVLCENERRDRLTPADVPMQQRLTLALLLQTHVRESNAAPGRSAK